MAVFRSRSSANDVGPVHVDINILPPELRRARFTRLTLVLFVLATLALVSVVAGYYVRQRVLDETAALETRLSAANSTINRLTDDAQRATQLKKEIEETRQSIEDTKRDFAAFDALNITWSAIMDSILGKNASGITFTSLSQSQTTIVLDGFAPNGNRVVDYGNALLNSGHFSRVQLMSFESQVSTDSSLPTPIPGQPTATPTPATTPVPGTTPTATPETPTTPADAQYIVLSKERVPYADTSDRYSIVKGRVLDQSGQLIPGLRFRVRSCCPLWTDDYPNPGDPASDGTFEFLVGKLKFDLYIIDETGEPISEISQDMATDDPGFTGYYVWNVIFQKRSNGQPLATATPSSGTPSPSATPGTPTTTPPLEQGTPSPTATPSSTTPSGLPTTGTERLTMSIPENVRRMLAAQVSPVSFVLEIEVNTGGEEE